MKQKIFIGLFFFLVATGISYFYYHPRVSEISAPVGSSVYVTIDTGTSIATVSGVRANNVYDALVKAAKENKLDIKTKQYDFGIFIEQIGAFTNTKEKSWIYFVNGESGTMAADKKSITNNDSIEWRYMKPIFE